MRSVFLDFLAAVWLPLLAGAVMGIGTWAVWFYSGVPDASAAESCRSATPLARYITLGVLHHCYIHATIAFTLTGGPDIMLFIRERLRNQRAEKEAEERRQQEKQEAEERYQREQKQAEERRQQEQERRQQERERYERERKEAQEHTERMFNLLQTALEQAHTERRLAEERAAANQQAFLNTLTAILARRGNGNGGAAGPGNTPDGGGG